LAFFKVHFERPLLISSTGGEGLGLFDACPERAGVRMNR
jgi:hypothetical protein